MSQTCPGFRADRTLKLFSLALGIASMLVSSAARGQGARTVQFPADRAIGLLGLREPGFDWAYGRPGSIYYEQALGEARGVVSVPPGGELALEIRPGDDADLSVLDALDPGALQVLLIHAPIDESELRHVSRLTGLTTLNFVGANKTDAALRYLRDLSELRVLGMSGTSITDDGLERLTHFTRLRFLNLNGVGAITPEGVRRLASLPRLEHLGLDPSQITRPMIEALRDLPALTEISILGRNLAPEKIRLLMDLPDLESLVLSTHDDDSVIGALSELPSLKVLYLPDTRISALGLDELEHRLSGCKLVHYRR